MFRESLLVLALVLLLVTGFYGVTARFWVHASGRRLATLLASLLALTLYVLLARYVPDRTVRLWIGTGLMWVLIFAVARMGVTMFANWRHAGDHRRRALKERETTND